MNKYKQENTYEWTFIQSFIYALFQKFFEAAELVSIYVV